MGKVTIKIATDKGQTGFEFTQVEANLIDCSLALGQLKLVELKLLQDIVKLSNSKQNDGR